MKVVMERERGRLGDVWERERGRLGDVWERQGAPTRKFGMGVRAAQEVVIYG